MQSCATQMFARRLRTTECSPGRRYCSSGRAVAPTNPMGGGRRPYMKRCPKSGCGSWQAWTLGDGRYKCHACGTRYSWKSVWDSVRLDTHTKEQLVEAFVHGVPAYRQRHDD